MTAGASGTYAINGTDLVLQPTTGKWIPRDSLGFDGAGHPIYPGVRQFEMTFALEEPSDFYQVQNYYNMTMNTGTVVVDLPKYGANTYIFFSYTGCVLQEPYADEYFSEYHTNVTLLITNVRT
jgi:hypothetical protein